MNTTLKSKRTYSFFENIFARFWAAWGLVWFIVTFLIIFLPSMLSYAFKDERKGQDYFIFVSRIWMRLWLTLIACPAKILGRNNFAKDKTYIVVFNHNALLDPPLSAPFIPAGNKTIAKSSLAKVPIFGLFYKRGAVLVDRSDDKSRFKSYDQMRATLRKHIHMCIYPEGTRNRTEAPLKNFYDGAFKLAVDSGNEIMPCIISGTTTAMPIHKKFFLLPAKLKMEFMEPVSPAGLDVQQLKQKVYDLMLQKFLESSTKKIN